MLPIFYRTIVRFMIGPDGEENILHKEWLGMFQDVLDEFRESLRAQGRDGEFIGAKVLVIPRVKSQCR
jgi:adenosine deaminase CECR1